MACPATELPSWDDLQVLTAQLHRFPRLDDEPVDTSVTIGPAAAGRCAWTSRCSSRT
jgi:hypothetical protein